MVYTSNDKPSGVMGSCETIFYVKFFYNLLNSLK